MSRLLGSIYWVTGAVASFGALIWLFKGCRHPNPHFVKQETRRDETTGDEVVVHAAHYCCYECGKSWLAKQRDPAWTPSAIVQKFHGTMSARRFAPPSAVLSKSVSGGSSRCGALESRLL